MPPVNRCWRCANRAGVKRPGSGAMLCTACFFREVEDEVHECIQTEQLLKKGDIVACGASGGKDSTVLIHLLTLLNERHQYGLDIRLLSIDEGIIGYRDDSLTTVHENAATYRLPLTILSYADLFGWTMDEIVKAVGLKNNCTYCGVLRRQSLERGAAMLGATVMATGHNADDNAETVLMNVLRADLSRLNSNKKPSSSTESFTAIPRSKPLKTLYQKDIVMYAYHKKLVYFTTECTYAQEAYRGSVRELIKQLEAIQPKCIRHINENGGRLPLEKESNAADSKSGAAAIHPCPQCGAGTNQARCRACQLLSSLGKEDRPHILL